MAKEYIKREVALESLCTGCEYVPIDEKENCPYRFTGCQEYANIFSIPAADVVARDCYDSVLAENDELRKERPVRHGRWFDVPYTKGRRPTVIRYCSLCGHNNNNRKTNYRPNCGAKMDKDGDGETLFFARVEAEAALKGETEDV